MSNMPTIVQISPERGMISLSFSCHRGTQNSLRPNARGSCVVDPVQRRLANSLPRRPGAGAREGHYRRWRDPNPPIED